MARFRLYPTPDQQALLVEHCDHARFVWNLGLEQRSQYRPGRGPTPRYIEQSAQLTEARACNEWLRAGSQTVQQQALRDLDAAFRNFFAGTHGYPTWRRKRGTQGFRIVGGQATRFEQVNRKWGRVLVPKVGWVKFRLSRPLPDARSYRVTLDRSGRWHIAFAVIPEPMPAPNTGEIVGIDRGVAVSAALSTGELLQCPRLTPGEADRLVRLQRRLARATPGSNRRKRVVRSIASLHARAGDRRKNWVEQTSTDLARRFDLIGLEHLRVRQMTRSARGTIENPGTNVRGKQGLNREIMQNGWGLLAQRIQDKAAGRVVLVPAAWTSQKCNACGHVDANSRQSQAEFACVACKAVAHADINAARNIRDLAVAASITAAGRAVAGRGDSPLGESVRRQPQRDRATKVA